ncbi:chromosomal replication initiator protein DnaA [Aerococcus vaginalis]
MSVMEDLWKRILDYFREQMTAASFDTWIADLTPLRLANDTLYLQASSDLHKQQIEKHYLVQMRQVMMEFLDRDAYIEVEVESNNKVANFTQSKEQNNESSYENSALNPKYTFDNFIVGDGNKMARAAAMAVAASPGVEYNPLFLYGGVGLGKTHLMQAIGHEILANNPNAKVKYVTSEQFTNDFVEAIRNHSTPQFHEEYRTVDLLLVDDIQFIGGNKQSTQEEFFHTFNALYNNNKHIVLTSDRDASQIPELENRLVSRFKQGLSTDITPPDLETRIAILRNKAEINHIDVSNETMTYIAGQIDSNVRELEGALTSVNAYAKMMNEPLTLDVAAKALRNYKNESSKNVTTIPRIQQVVADYFDITVEDLTGKTRKRSIVVPRQIAMYLAREITKDSLPTIGKEFGGKDHTTVMHAVERVETLLKESPDTRSDISSIKNLL